MGRRIQYPRSTDPLALYRIRPASAQPGYGYRYAATVAEGARIAQELIRDGAVPPVHVINCGGQIVRSVRQNLLGA